MTLKPTPPLQAVRELIERKTGIVVVERDYDQFQQTIEKHIRQSGMRDIEEYRCFLEGVEIGSSIEWSRLLAEITIGESYFFRDIGLHELLQHQILPDLLNQNKENHRLRFWSAGCATGEEPYSIAMLLDRILPWHEHWDLHILATDVNRQSLERAEKGLYREWSFRRLPAYFKERYFRKRKEEWRLEKHIRRMVDFRYSNLIEGNYSLLFGAEANGLDCIICRNLFIYFNRDMVARIVARFADILKPGGYLITGHSEVHGQVPASLRVRVFEEAVIYHKSKGSGRATVKVQLPPEFAPGAPVPPLPRPQVNTQLQAVAEDEKRTEPVPPPPPSLSPGEVNRQNSEAAINGWFKEAQALFQACDYEASIKKNQQILKHHSDHFDALSLMAHAYANIGKIRQATDSAEKALEVDEFNTTPYYLLAHLAEVSGNKRAAKQLLHKVIYLSPTFVPAYLDLGALFKNDGALKRARSMRKTALELLLTMAPEYRFDSYNKLTVAELIDHVKNTLAESSLHGERP